MKDLNANDIEAAMLMIEGSARSMGIRCRSNGDGETSKRFMKAIEGVDAAKSYPVEEAVKLVKSRATAKFDETIEIAINLGVDPRHADQMVRGVVALPNGTGRNQRVAVFAKGPKADEAKSCRSRHRGRRRSGGEGAKGRDRFRPLHRDARHDGRRRPARQGVGPARPDAQSEGRHCYDGRDRRRERLPRAARSSSASKRRASSRRASARRVSARKP